MKNRTNKRIIIVFALVSLFIASIFLVSVRSSAYNTIIESGLFKQIRTYTVASSAFSSGNIQIGNLETKFIKSVGDKFGILGPQVDDNEVFYKQSLDEMNVSGLSDNQAVIQLSHSKISGNQSTGSAQSQSLPSSLHVTALNNSSSSGLAINRVIGTYNSATVAGLSGTANMSQVPMVQSVGPQKVGGTPAEPGVSGSQVGSLPMPDGFLFLFILILVYSTRKFYFGNSIT